jgi:sugar phosphate isomerase/epimerase
MRKYSLSRRLAFWMSLCLALPALFGAQAPGAAAATAAASNAASSLTTPSGAALGPLVPFGLCMNNQKWQMSPEEQVALCLRDGFTGMALSGGDLSPARLKRFAENPEVASGRFRVYAALWWLPLDQEIDAAWLSATLTQAARMDMALWVVIDGKKTKENVAAATDKLALIAAACAKAGTALVLYPHAGTTFTCAEEALPILLELRARGFATVTLSLHLCHEQSARTDKRIAEVAAKVAPYLSLVTVNGSNGGGSILPLGQGSYDPMPFIRALAAVGYSGPVVLHTYNLADPRKDDHLARSLAAWGDYLKRL